MNCRWIGVALAALMLAVGGCMDYEEVMVINADGSGTVKMHYALDKAVFEGLRSMAESADAGDDSAFATGGIFSQAEIENTLADNDQGIKLVSFEESETEGAYICDMEFSFADIAKLEYLSEALSSEEEGYSADQGKQTYGKQDDGTWLFVRSFAEDDETDLGEWDESIEEAEEYEDWEEEDWVEDSEEGGDTAELEAGMEEFAEAMESMSEQMMTMAEGMGKHKISFTVTFPHKIVETNATSFEGNTATWEYSLTEMSMGPPEMRAVLAP